jgi:hypothetical protein
MFLAESSCIRAEKLLSSSPSQQTRNQARCRLPWLRKSEEINLQQTGNQ